MFLEPNRTAWDLRWRMFGVDVRIHPMFWLLTAFLGFNACTSDPILPGGGMMDLTVWIFACLSSILLHEFGHVWMSQLFGHRRHIVLYSFGGLAIGTREETYRWQRIAVSLAGPGIQLLLCAVLWGAVTGANHRFRPWMDRARTPDELLLNMLWQINFYWALLNLAPIWPLDGGKVTRELAEAVLGQRGAIAALWLSLIFSAFIAVHAIAAKNKLLDHPVPYLPTGLWIAILFGMLAFGSYQALQAENSRRRDWDDDPPWMR
jgi:Zn-dependent protease